MKCLSAFVRISVSTIAAGVWSTCSSLPANPLAPPIMVYDRGSMKEIYQDDAAAKINLTELKNSGHLYALGELSRLRGEVLIWDSQPYESHLAQGELQVKSDWSESAAYLVWASVQHWRKTKVPTSVRSLEMLELWLTSISGKPGSPLRRQYPFLIKGHFARIFWHIADVHDDGKPLTPEKELRQRYRGVSRDQHAQIVGFYSPEQQGFFIPKGHCTHMHLKIEDNLVAHVDDFDPFGETGLTLYVPVAK